MNNYNYNRSNYNNNFDSGSKIDSKSINEENFADKAEEVIKSVKESRKSVSTSQLRPILTLIHACVEDSEKIKGDGLNTDTLSKIQYLKMKLAYAAGREESVKEFAEKADLFNFISEVSKLKSKKKLKLLDKYFEALVAYHRYFGGKE